MTATHTFGAELRALRKNLHLSQEALADQLGTTQRHLSFLETGRSAPTRPMLARLVTKVRLSIAQRAALFEASGFRNPYPHRSLDDAELNETLDLLQRQVLRHWPFPGFLVDRDWNFLRSNAAGRQMLEMFQAPPNMHALFLSPAFRGLIENWEEASSGFYYRIQQVARRSDLVRDALDAAVAEGHFNHVGPMMAGPEDVPIYVPIVVKMPDGPRMKITSLHGSLVSIHDAVAEGFEVELMVPLDEATEGPLLQVFGGG